MMNKSFKKVLVLSSALLFFIFFAINFSFDNSSDTLRLAIALEPDSLDLHTYSTYQHALVAHLFAGTLLDRDENGAITGAAVKYYRQVAPTEWLFTLRSDVFFQNGARLTSDDVKYSLERTAKLNKKDFATISRVDVVDELNFKIVTVSPDPLLPSRLVPLGFIVPKKEVDDAGGPEQYFGKGLISGFGPYRLVRWEKGKYIEMRANPSYYKGPPAIGKIIFIFEPQIDKRVTMLLSGDVDIVADIPPMSTLSIQKSGKAVVLKGATSQYLFGNMRIPDSTSPLADLRVRKALNMAIDRMKLIQIFELGNGLPIPTVFVKQAFGYLDLPAYAYDPTTAKKLLKDAGFSTGLVLSMLTASDLSPLAKVLKSQFEAIGVTLNVTEIKRDDGILEWLVKQVRNEDLFLLNPIDPMIDVGYHVETLIARYPRQALPVIPQLQGLFKKSNETTVPADRIALLQQIQKTIYDQALYLFLWQRLSMYGVSTRVHGFSIFIDGMIRLDGVTVDK